MQTKKTKTIFLFLIFFININSFFLLIQNQDNHIFQFSNGNLNNFPNSAAPPTLFTVYINDEEITKGTPVSIVMGDKFKIKIETDNSCESAQVNLSTISYSDSSALSHISTFLWEVEIDTENFQGQKLWIDTYSIEFFLTYGSETNLQGDPDYLFEDIIEIVEPIDIVTIVITIIIIAICGALGIILFIKRKSINREQKVKSVLEPKKKEIYSGASQIGKMSGSAADSLKSSRVKRRPGEITKTSSITVKSPIREAEVDISNPAYLKKLPSSMQMKFAERTMGVNKRAQFLGSKIDSLFSQIDILTTIISMKKPQENCPICGKSIGENWEFCPYCKIANKEDEINMKRSLINFNNIKSICPDCGLMLNTTWLTCPRCFVKTKK
ncbi:MAG: hypothetical protein GY870_20055 [archaeon]|nr:hypothetical protein [archaeon]